jgi:hypothetical protein
MKRGRTGRKDGGSGSSAKVKSLATISDSVDEIFPFYWHILPPPLAEDPRVIN